MKITAQALAAITAAFPHHAAHIAARAMAGDDEATLRNDLARLDRDHAEARLAEAVKALDAEKSAHAKTAAELKTLAESHARLSALAGGAPKDPGAGSPPGNGTSATEAELAAMNPRQRAAFFAGGGKIAGE